MESEIKALVNQKQSLDNVNLMLSMALKSEQSLQELMDIFLYGTWRECQVTSWAVGKLAEKNSNLLFPFLDKMIEKFQTPNHQAVTRNIIRTWSFMTLPDSKISIIYDICTQLFLNPNQDIAIRAFAIKVCINICKRYPDLGFELLLNLETLEMPISRGLDNTICKSIVWLDKNIKA